MAVLKRAPFSGARFGQLPDIQGTQQLTRADDVKLVEFLAFGRYECA